MSQLEVDKIIPQSGTTITIGESGDTVSFAEGTNLGIDTNTLVIDSTNNRVGIKNASPTVELDVTGDINITGTATFSSSDTTDQFVITNTDADASSAPDFVLFRNSATPADNDVLARIDFRGRNDNSQDVDYMLMYAQATDVSDGSEDVVLTYEGKKAGSNHKLFSIGSSEVVVNEDSGDVNFRVESDANANMFFVDASQSKIGILNNSPAQTLDISDTTTTSKTLRVGQSSGTSNADATVIISSGGTGDAMLRFDYEGSNTDRARLGTSSSGQNLLFFTAGDNERMRIDNSGNVGIGTSSPSQPLEVSGGNPVIKITDTNNTTGQTGLVSNIQAEDSAGTQTWVIGNQFGATSFYIANKRNSATRFETNGTERMRIKTDGNVLIGTTSATGSNPKLDVVSGSGQTAMTVYREANTTAPTIMNWRSDVTATADIKAEVECNGDFNNDTGSYAAFSDINLKQDIVDAQSQWEDIKALQVKNFKLKKYVNAYGEDAPTHIGVIAQEVEASGMNGLVSENEEGTKYVKYSILYMKAVKALQEAMTRIESLETENTDIKARLNTLEGN